MLHRYGFNTGQMGLAFIPVAIGVTSTTLATPWIYKRYKSHLHRIRDEAEAKDEPASDPPPEERLITAMYGTWLVPISLFWL